MRSCLSRHLTFPFEPIQTKVSNGIHGRVSRLQRFMCERVLIGSHGFSMVLKGTGSSMRKLVEMSFT